MKKEYKYQSINLRRSPRIRNRINRTIVTDTIDPLVKTEEDEKEKTRLTFWEHTDGFHQDDLSKSKSSSGKKPQGSKNANNKLYCKECNFIYSSIDLFVAHQKQIHKDAIPSNYCQFCDTHFLRAGNYSSHMEIFHANKIHNYCDICQKQFKIGSVYLSHMKETHKIDTMTKRCNSNNALDLKDPNLNCNICRYTFSSRSTYNRHLRDFHNYQVQRRSPSEILYPDRIPNIHNQDNFCSACDYTFGFKTSYYRHLRNIHHLKTPKRVSSRISK